MTLAGILSSAPRLNAALTDCRPRLDLLDSSSSNGNPHGHASVKNATRPYSMKLEFVQRSKVSQEFDCRTDRSTFLLGGAASLASCAGSRWLHWLAAVACLVCVVGCDKARFASQRVEIGVTRLASGHPVANAVVTCARTERWGPSRLYPVERYLDGFSDKSQVTNSSGRAEFPLRIGIVRGGLLVWLWLDPMKLKDTVTGETYFFRIQEGARETLTVRMVPGESVKGEHFMLAVHAIGPPKPD